MFLKEKIPTLINVKLLLIFILCRVERGYFLSPLAWLVLILTLCSKWFSVLITISDTSKLAVDLALQQIYYLFPLWFHTSYMVPLIYWHLPSCNKILTCRWDMLIADLELVETIDGYCDVVYGTYEPKYLNWYFSLMTVWIIPSMIAMRF